VEDDKINDSGEIIYQQNQKSNNRSSTNHAEDISNVPKRQSTGYAASRGEMHRNHNLTGYQGH